MLGTKRQHVLRRLINNGAYCGCGILSTHSPPPPQGNRKPFKLSPSSHSIPIHEDNGKESQDNVSGDLLKPLVVIA